MEKIDEKDLSHLIRLDSDEILSATLTDVDEKSLEFHYINFRKAVYPDCGILFYEFQNELYYPFSMEFRLIDNNILFLIEELKISCFSDLSIVLKSSFKREEGKEVEFFPVLHKTKSMPKFSLKLSNFKIDADDVKIIAD